MSPSARRNSPANAEGAADLRRPISALLSQALVAFTVELDNEFELRMTQLGFVGGRLSLAVWLNLLRFVGDSPLTVKQLEAQSMLEQTQIKPMLGCLERWGFVWIAPSHGRFDAGTLIAQMQASRG